MSENNILIVDSDPLSVEIITHSLDRNGYNITAIDNGETAIRMISENDYDLVLSELVLGAFDGLKVFHKAKEKNPNNGVIILTDHPEKISTKDIMALEIDAFLFKPIDPEKILNCVDHCIKLSEIKHSGKDRRTTDRRKSNDPSYKGPERRKQDRRKVCF